MRVAEVVPVLATPPLVSGLGLFPRRTLSEIPSTTGTADCAVEAEVDDGAYYFLKNDSGNKRIRASEWLTTQLAEDVHIAAPQKALVQMFDGTIAFGSRRMPGVADRVITSRYLLASTIKDGEVSRLARILSAIYAFDLFVNNDDRHIENYLTVEEGGVRRLYAFDYSRAFFWDWPWNGFPGPGSNTRLTGKKLRACHGFDQESAEEVLNRLSHVSPARILSVLNEMPEDWLDRAIKQSLIGMWSGDQRLERISNIRKGLADGWLL